MVSVPVPVLMAILAKLPGAQAAISDRDIEVLNPLSELKLGYVKSDRPDVPSIFVLTLEVPKPQPRKQAKILHLAKR